MPLAATVFAFVRIVVALADIFARRIFALLDLPAFFLSDPFEMDCIDLNLLMMG